MDEQGREPADELTLEPAATVRTHRPRALWAVLAAVGLAAGVLVVTSSDDGSGPPGLPVDLAFGGAGTGEAAADSSRAAWVTYVAGDDLPSLGGEGRAYRVSAEVDEARVRALADALGLEGELRSADGAWSVTGAGGLGRLGVVTGGGAHWSYFSGYDDCVTADGSIGACSEECAVDSDGTERCSTTATAEVPPTTTVVDGGAAPTTAECAAPEPGEEPGDCEDVVTTVAPDTGSDCRDDDCIAPDSEPSEPVEPVTPPEGVRQAALDVVAAAGFDVDGAIVTAVNALGEEAPDVWYVTVEPRLEGVPSGLLSFVEVGPDRQVLSANGVLGAIEDLGAYPLLDTRSAIERANAQVEGGDGSTDVAGTTGDVEVTSGDDQPVTTAVECVPPEGASDGCGGTTGCGADGCETTTTSSPCMVQADGSEVCEPVDCPQVLEGEEGTGGAPSAPGCTPPIDPVPVPLPEPEPVEVLLVDAERSLVLLPATDGTGDGYLVPAYRFTADDSGQVDVPAVADEALTGPSTTEATTPDTAVPSTPPVPEPPPCDVLEEDDASGSTHTVQTCPTPNEDPPVLGEGEEPAIGVGYHVDVDKRCAGGSFVLGGQVWISEDDAPSTWGDPEERHEGGTFMLDAPDHGSFVGDAAGTKVGRFRTLPHNEDVFCTPEPRS